PLSLHDALPIYPPPADARRSKLGPQFVSEVLQAGDHVTGHAALLGLKLAHDAHEMAEQIGRVVQEYPQRVWVPAERIAQAAVDLVCKPAGTLGALFDRFVAVALHCTSTSTTVTSPTFR